MHGSASTSIIYYDTDLVSYPVVLVINFFILIRGEPERAPNTRVTYGEFAVPMYVCIYVYVCVRVYVDVGTRRPRAHSACAICLRITSSRSTT